MKYKIKYYWKHFFVSLCLLINEFEKGAQVDEKAFVKRRAAIPKNCRQQYRHLIHLSPKKFNDFSIRKVN